MVWVQLRTNWFMDELKMTNERIKELAKQAGFVFWEDGQGIDWGSDYTEDLINFYHLTLEKAAQICEDNFSSDGHWCAEQIRKLK